jgi:hypothetical protein
MDGKKLFEQHLRQRNELNEAQHKKILALKDEFIARKEVLEKQDEAEDKAFCDAVAADPDSPTPEAKAQYAEAAKLTMVRKLIEKITGADVVHVTGLPTDERGDVH